VHAIAGLRRVVYGGISLLRRRIDPGNHQQEQLADLGREPADSRLGLGQAAASHPVRARRRNRASYSGRIAPLPQTPRLQTPPTPPGLRNAASWNAAEWHDRTAPRNRADWRAAGTSPAVETSPPR